MTSDKWVLESCWHPEKRDNGRLEITLSIPSSKDGGSFRLCFTSQLSAIDSTSVNGGHLYRVDGSYHEVIPSDDRVFAGGEKWSFTFTKLNFKPSHANDGPISAFVITDHGEAVPVHVRELLSMLPDIEVSHAEVEPIESKCHFLAITPYPNEVKLSPGFSQVPTRFMLLTSCIPEIAEQVNAADQLRSSLFPYTTKLFHCDSNNADGAQLSITLVNSAAESYLIRFTQSGVEIQAGDLAGVFYACVSLCQLCDGVLSYPGRYSYPAPGSTIGDSPRHQWRGTHLDVARHFFQPTDIKRLIAIAAWYKLNRFHWHLTDDESWRVEIKAYPELIELGSIRGLGKLIPPQLGDGPEGSGGHYSQGSIKRMVNYAQQLHVEIMPEIDMPGHSTAALRSVANLVDVGEKINSYKSVQGFYNNALNPALPETIQFAFSVIDELAPLFPGSVFHIGGDEVPESAWEASPVARDFVKAQNLPSIAYLQARFLSQLQSRLMQHGKKTGVWDDGVNDLLDPANTMAFVWRDTSYAEPLAKKGFDLVMTPAQAYYLDIAQSDHWNEAGAGWTGPTSLETTYRYDYAFESVANQFVMGVQGGIWSEHIANISQFNHLVFPRLIAIAECAWTKRENKSWPRFSIVAGLRHPSLGY